MNKNHTVSKRSLSQFFEDDTGRLSMSRLLCFLSFWPAAYVVVITLSAEALACLLGAFPGAYVGGKWADSWKERGGRRAAVPDR